MIDLLISKKVESFESKDFKIKLSPLAFIPEISEGGDKLPVPENEDELLFYSAPGRPNEKD